MIPYILLIAIPALFCFVAVQKRDKKRVLCVGNNNFIRESNSAIFMFFAMLFLMVSLRHDTVGNDTQNYAYYFDRYRDYSFSRMMKTDIDILFVLYNHIISNLTDNYSVYLTVTSIFIFVPLIKLYMEDRRYSFLKIILFVNMSIFILLFSGIRQWMAMSMGILAYDCVRKKQPIRFLFWCLVAIGFHHSAFMLFPMYPLYYMTFKKKHLLFVVPVMLVVFVLNEQIFGVISNILMRYSDKYSMVTEQTGAFMTLIMFALFAVFAYVVPEEGKMDREMLGLRNFLLLAVVLQCFAPVHSLAMRMNYYYILFIPVLLPKVIAVAAPGKKQLAQVGRYVLCVFFVLYFFRNCFNALKTGEGMLNTVPYIPFWDNP